MRRIVGVAGTVLALVSTPLIAGNFRPTPVSPGNPAGIALVEARCPSFSWGTADGAAGYELSVYQIGKGGEALPVVEHRVPGSASSWTPDLGQCLAPGGRYAWSIRALNADGSAEPAWSEPRLFEVAAGPTRTEFEEALAIVRRYLETEDTAAAQAENAAHAAEGTTPRRSRAGARRRRRHRDDRRWAHRRDILSRRRLGVDRSHCRQHNAGRHG